MFVYIDNLQQDTPHRINIFNINKKLSDRSINDINGVFKKGVDKNGQNFYSWSETSYINGNGQIVKRDCQLHASIDVQENITRIKNIINFLLHLTF